MWTAPRSRGPLRAQDSSLAEESAVSEKKSSKGATETKLCQSFFEPELLRSFYSLESARHLKPRKMLMPTQPLANQSPCSVPPPHRVGMHSQLLEVQPRLC